MHSQDFVYGGIRKDAVASMPWRRAMARLYIPIVKLSPSSNHPFYIEGEMPLAENKPTFLTNSKN